MPAILAGCINIGVKTCFVVAYSNGSVRLYQPDTGSLLAEVGAHSRQINGLACHPAQGLFATCADDSFMNVWKVTPEGNVTIMSSSRVPDFQLTGVCFAGKFSQSVVASVYDYKQLIVWD